jgi:hypothetical protein
MLKAHEVPVVCDTCKKKTIRKFVVDTDLKRIWVLMPSKRGYRWNVVTNLVSDFDCCHRSIVSHSDAHYFKMKG